MTTHQPDPDHSSDRFTDTELRRLLQAVLTVIRDEQPLDQDTLDRIETAVASRP